jgi:hypothetical protein
MEMCHGESQEEGQEESQEEIISSALNPAGERLSRPPQNSKTMPAQAGIVVSEA